MTRVDESVETVEADAGPIEAQAPTETIMRYAESRWSPRAAFWVVQVSHAVIDVYPMFIAALAVMLNERLRMTPGQYAAMFAVGPIVSGLPQAFFAWATDKFDTRFCGWFGLAIGSACLCSIGYAQTFEQLLILQIIGLTGTGMFHPIGAALAGQLARYAVRHGRAWGVSIFYSAGMIGAILGPILCTRMTIAFGMKSLAWIIPPSLLVAWVLFLATSKAPHRPDGHAAIHRAIPPDERRERWRAVGLLFVGNTFRFIVNTGLIVMFGYWSRARFPADTDAATRLTGNLCSALAVGMLIFGLLGGRLMPAGRERAPMIWLTLFGAVSVATLGLIGHHLGLWAMYAACVVSALGFAAVIPGTVSLAQRLLPGRTGLASGLMLGTSWCISAVAPLYISLMLGRIPLEQVATLPMWRLDAAFGGFGVMLLVSAALAWMIPSGLLERLAKQG